MRVTIRNERGEPVLLRHASAESVDTRGTGPFFLYVTYQDGAIELVTLGAGWRILMEPEPAPR